MQFLRMQSDFIPVLVQALIAAGFVVVVLVASVLGGRRVRRNRAKDSAYECGMLPVGPAQTRFSVKFYLVAMLFVLFDIEVVFLYPWAVTFDRLGLFALIEMVLFVAAVFVAYAYVWRRGGLEWD